jgi:SAM-dependent methyltransferase
MTTTTIGHQASVGHHAQAAQRSRDQLAQAWLRQGKLWLLPMLLSDYGRLLLERKYDAIATDYAYDVHPAGRLGPLGRAVDWFLLQQDIHVGLRQRLAILEEEIAVAAGEALASGNTPVQLVSGPCGLARDLRQAWLRLGRPGPDRLRLLGLDLDASGEVMPLARERAAEAGVRLDTLRCDLLDAAQLDAAFAATGPADVFVCIGLAVWLEPPDLDRLLSGIRRHLADGGSLIVDNFGRHSASRFAADFEMVTHYHPDQAFAAALARAGFAAEARRETPNHVNVVYRCRAV